MNTISFYTQLIEDEIKNLALPQNPASLYEPVKYMMGLGGKRIRPVMTLMANEMFGGETKAAIRPALAIEMFHNFTLVHDDIMDHSAVRRGSPTVHKKWNEETAILSGDVMLVLAYELLSDINSDKLPAVLALFNDSAKKVCEGQQLDMIFETRNDVTIEQYIDMIGRKTGALFAGSLKMGALIAGCSNEDTENMYRFGLQAGIAFQIQDDILDSYGQSGTIGKTVGGDIASNKKTYLAIKAYETADSAMRDALNLLASDASISRETKINNTLSIYNALSIKQQAEETREQYYGMAMESLDKVHIAETEKQSLRNVAETLINRDK